MVLLWFRYLSANMNDVVTFGCIQIQNEMRFSLQYRLVFFELWEDLRLKMPSSKNNFLSMATGSE